MTDALSWFSHRSDLSQTTTTTPMPSLPTSPSLPSTPVSFSSPATSPPTPPSISLLLSLPDLLCHTSHYLRIDELLCCTALSSHLHRIFDSDKVWRRRLGAARHIQSSWVPLEIQRPYVHSEDDEAGEDEKRMTDEEDKYSLRLQEEQLAAAQAMLWEQSRRGTFEPCASSPPPLALALALCRFYYIYRVNANNHLNCDITPLAILPIPPPFQPSTAGPAHNGTVCVYHCRFLLTRDRLVNKSDARELRLVWDEESGQWQVAAMLKIDSGVLALNVHNVRDGRIVVPDEPLPPTLSCKQRYIRLLVCSCHSNTHCHRLLPPTPAFPPPRPIPAWFSHHLAQFSIRQEPFPPIPPTPYLAHHPLPVCAGCRLDVKEGVRVFSEAWRDREGVLGFEVDCLVRVNEREWDVRWRAYADDVTYRRCILVTDGDGDDDEADNRDDEDEDWRVDENDDDELLPAEGQARREGDEAGEEDHAEDEEEEEKGEGKEDRERAEGEAYEQPAQDQQHQQPNPQHQHQAARHNAAGAVQEDGDGEEEEEEPDEWVESASQPADEMLQWIYGQLADATAQQLQQRLREEAEAAAQVREGEEKGQRPEGQAEGQSGSHDRADAIDEDATTPRPTSRPRANSLSMSDTTASSVAASTAATLASSSVSSPSSSTATSTRRRPLFRVDRVLMDNDSGVYAINASSNVPWAELAPRSSPATHPPVLFMHDHPLFHHTRSVYRNGEYVCDVCHELHDSSNGGVWHCDHCSYDCCEARVEESRREQEAAMAQIEDAAKQAQSRPTAASSSNGISID